jgi:hypothetical protein
MSKVSAKITPVRIFVEQPGKVAIAEATADVIREQCLDGVSASGARFPTGKTKNPLTMYDTGRMLDRDVTISAGVVRYEAPYADIVNAKYNFAGVSPEYAKRLESKLQQQIEQYVKTEE